MRRCASVIGLKPEHEAQYRALHAKVWPGVLAALKRAHVRNYSIFLRDGQLISYYEYMGNDHDADLAKLAEDPVTREWWTLTSVCQQPVETAEDDQWWAPAQEVFHCD